MRPPRSILLVVLGLLPAALAGQAEIAPAQAQAIVSAAPDPMVSRTGDRVVFRATLQMPEDCAWRADVAVQFGLQPELGPGTGWGLDLSLGPGTISCIPGAIQFSVESDLGLLPVASGSGVARLLVDGNVADTAPFTLTVQAGPAPGWSGPTADARLQVFVQTAGLAAYGTVLAIADNLHHSITFLDPITEIVTGSVRSPGNGNVRGLATDGDNFFVSVADAFGPRLYRITPSGTVLDSWTSPVVLPGPQALEAIAWKDGVLYGAYPSPPILFAVQPFTHQILWSRNLPARFTGLASVPGGFVGVDRTANFYWLDPGPQGGSLLIADLGDTGLAASADITDLTWDGRGLFAFDQNFASLWWVRTFALWWAQDGTLRAYAPPGLGPVDVIRGRLAELRFTSGNVSLGATACLMADGPGGVVNDAGPPPPPGEGYFYLARFEGDSGFDTSYGRGSDGFRRFEPAPACP